MPKQRTIVGEPLTPSLLRELDALAGFPPTPDGFVPDGSWVNAYRIWTCHGYRESGNDLDGLLRVERGPGDSADWFTLTVHQQIINDGAALNVIDASITCRANQIASPLRWRLSSGFIAPDGTPMEHLTVQQSAEVKRRTVHVRTQGKSVRRPGSRRLSADWCMFEAVQRLPFASGPALVLDMLEGMSVLREGHRLSYAGVERAALSGGELALHRFHALGHGLLPYEYWVDDRHRLVMAVMGARAYVLDDSAQEAFKQRVEGSRAYQQRRQQAAGGTSA